MFESAVARRHGLAVGQSRRHGQKGHPRLRRRKKINGRYRFIVTDTLGLLVVVCVMSASRQDRDGAKTTLLSTYLFSPIRHVFADQGFAGRLVDWAAETLNTTVEIVRKPSDQIGFVVHPKRWVVERSLAWPTAHRRLARDYERDPAVSEALPLGRDRHHGPPPGPRSTCHPPEPPCEPPAKP